MAGKEVGLPADVRTRVLRGVRYSGLEREEVFDKFVLKFLKLNSEDPENFKKCVIHLDKTLDRKIQRNNNPSKKLSYRKRKELGLLTLGKKSLKYKELIPLHKLWIEYMTTYINLNELKKQGWSNTPEDPNFEQISLKLYRADYHGCKMTVLKSLCPFYVGIKGIVVMETRNCFKLLGSDNKVRNIPKSSCVFKFTIDDFEFTFYGKNLQARPAERSSKKVKTVYVSDLLLFELQNGMDVSTLTDNRWFNIYKEVADFRKSIELGTDIYHVIKPTAFFKRKFSTLAPYMNQYLMWQSCNRRV